MSRIPWVNRWSDSKSNVQVDFWDQVVNEPWDGLFDIDPRVATKTPDTWGFDEVTMHFIDAVGAIRGIWALTDLSATAEGAIYATHRALREGTRLLLQRVS